MFKKQICSLFLWEGPDYYRVVLFRWAVFWRIIHCLQERRWLPLTSHRQL